MRKLIVKLQPGKKPIALYKSMSMSICEHELQGCIDYIDVDGVQMLFNQDSRYEGAGICLMLDGMMYFGNILIGDYTRNDTLYPITEEQCKRFVDHIVLMDLMEGL